MTPSVLPISRRSRSVFLKRMTEVREITFKAFTLERLVMMSSWIPRAKYSFSSIELRFSNGRTAMDGFSAIGSEDSATVEDSTGSASFRESKIPITIRAAMPPPAMSQVAARILRGAVRASSLSSLRDSPDSNRNR